MNRVIKKSSTLEKKHSPPLTTSDKDLRLKVVQRSYDPE